MLLNWLRKKLRSWLLDEETGPPSKMFEIRDGSELETVTATDVMGDCLKCRRRNGSELMVRVHQACNAEHFKALWKHLGGSKYVWEDGDPYDPFEEE